MALLLDVYLPAIRSAGAALLIVAVALLCGHALLPQAWRPPSARLRLPLAFGFGTLLLGWTGWLSGSLLGTWAIPVAWAALVSLSLRRGPSERLRDLRATLRRGGRLLAAVARARRLLAGLLLLALVPTLLHLLLPLLDSDGLRYHVALPKLFLLEGRVFLYRWDVAGYLPHPAETLYLAGTYLAGAQTAKHLHVLSFLATLVTLSLFVSRGRRYRSAALIAPLVLLASPAAIAPAPSGFTDYFALAPLAAALLLIDRGAAAGAVGLALGSAFAFKQTAAPFVAVLALLALGKAWGLGRGGTGRVRPDGPGAGASGARASAWLGRPREGRVSAGLSILLPILVAALPWAARNLFVTGDPVYPVGHVLLKRSLAGVSGDAVGFATHYHRIESGPLGLAWSPDIEGAAIDDVVGWHVLGALLLLPLLLRTRRHVWLLALVVPGVLAGLAFQPPARYFLGMLWALAGALSVSLAELAAIAATRARFAGALLGLSGLLLALPGLIWSLRLQLAAFSPLAVATGRLSREQALTAFLPGYRAARWVSSQPGPGRVLALDFPSPAVLDRPWLAEGALHDPPLKSWVAQGLEPGQILQRLNELGVRFLLVTPGYGGGTPISLLPLASTREEAAVVAGLRARLARRITLDGVDVYELPAPATGIPADLPPAGSWPPNPWAWDPPGAPHTRDTPGPSSGLTAREKALPAPRRRRRSRRPGLRGERGAERPRRIPRQP